MSQASPEANYQAIFDSALEVYKKKTGKDLTSHPLLRSFETCHSPDAVLAVLHAQTFGPGKPQSSGDKLLAWLNPTINVLNAFSATIGGGVSLAYPPAGVIFTGIGILLSAASAVSASRDLLLGLFDRIENVFRRLEVYIDVPQTPGMTDAIVKVMVEVLSILAIATKEINQRRAKTFLKKLVGRADIEDALRRLEEVTLEEARMASAESLKAIHGVGSNVQDALKAIDDRMRGMEGMLQGRLKVFDDGVKDKVINSTEKAGLQMSNDPDAAVAEGLKTEHGIDDKVQRVHGTLESFHNRAIDVGDVRNTVQDIGSRVIDGAQVIPNQSFTPY
ncbi:hypothetical protein DFH94DRAFT_684800 [Russula ochroleuca]|uniref:Fungal STAND N-terminal Goodbye domain-containing protein n=1 Tax=Russula ochroleuca TaxID=152965 RepID=A0A9P5MPM1_9AGAM|nr:hypothetical protein DFH94DRAFT_684800 [Russula ochroleuca]